MSGHKFVIIGLLLSAIIISCNSVKESRYSRYNKFSYEKEQPRFHFTNDTLAIKAEWYWVSDSRVIPKIKFIPDTPLHILRPIAKRHGRVLFATWLPGQKKFSKEGYIPIKRDDINYKNKFSLPFYIITLVNEKRFTDDTLVYKPRGRNNDYQFALYSTTPRLVNENYWLMEVIAEGEKRYYDFVCIMDRSYIPDSANKIQQASLFLEDIQQRFLTIDEELK